MSTTLEESGEVARRIARVAAELFAKRGYDATSVRNIVEAAAVTKPALYYYFQSKEGLAHALLTEPMTRLVATLRAIVDGPGNPIETLEQLLEAQFAFCREDPERARFVYALFFGPLGGSLSAELLQYAHSMRAIVEEAIQQLVADGTIDAERVDVFAASLRGLVTAYTMDFLYRDAPLDPELPRRSVQCLIQGFGGTSRDIAGKHSNPSITQN